MGGGGWVGCPEGRGSGRRRKAASLTVQAGALRA